MRAMLPPVLLLMGNCRTAQTRNFITFVMIFSFLVFDKLFSK